MTGVVSVGASAASRPDGLILVGNPNTGKTTLFNALCGARANTSNFPGTTTARRVGRARVSGGGGSLEVLDLPGVYDLTEDSPEARVATSALDAAKGDSRQVVIAILDASHLARNLTIVGQVIAMGCTVVVALNMVDLAEQGGQRIDAAELSHLLGVPVVPIVARTQQALEWLRQVMTAAAATPANTLPSGTSVEELARWADAIAHRVSSGRDGDEPDTATDRIDAWLTHPITGVGIFVALMASLFYLIFSMATIPMNLIEAMFSSIGRLVEGALPPGPVRDLLTDGIVGGLAATVVFLPQICLLFFLISLLEDTGYLARAAFVMDRLLAPFGLPGHAFAPFSPRTRAPFPAS
ncbi:MAG: FeoB small GTPase domain-containing protein [Vicinamibacterales bacterium]